MVQPTYEVGPYFELDRSKRGRNGAPVCCVRMHCYGTFREAFELHNFPFDTQVSSPFAVALLPSARNTHLAVVRQPLNIVLTSHHHRTNAPGQRGMIAFLGDASSSKVC